MRLIVTEKNNSAKKIAEILSGGTAKEESSFKTPYYTWDGDEGPQMTIGLKGHVLNPAFPEEYKSWQQIDLEALQEVVEANPQLGTAEGVDADGTAVKRARYSALTKDEIRRAFDNLDELSMPLANAGAARQDIDLIWGAPLPRGVSRAPRRFGSNFLS